MIRLFAGVFVLVAASGVATAADRAAIVETSVASPGLWRGHFSGGFNYNPPAQTIALAWSDQVAYFPDNHSCRRWMRGLKAQYGTYQGFGGCLRIR